MQKKDFQPFTEDLQQLVHQKHQLWKRWIISKDEEIHRQYKIIRNKVKIETIKVTEQEQRRVAIDCKKNPKRFWQYINKKAKVKTSIGDLRWQDTNGIEMISRSR